MVLDINYLIVCKEYTKRDAKQKKNQLQVTRIKKKKNYYMGNSLQEELCHPLKTKKKKNQKKIQPCVYKRRRITKKKAR